MDLSQTRSRSWIWTSTGTFPRQAHLRAHAEVGEKEPAGFRLLRHFDECRSKSTSKSKSRAKSRLCPRSIRGLSLRSSFCQLTGQSALKRFVSKWTRRSDWPVEF